MWIMYLKINKHISYDVVESVKTSCYEQIQIDVYNYVLDSIFNYISLSTFTPVRNCIQGSIFNNISREIHEYQFDNYNKKNEYKTSNCHP